MEYIGNVNLGLTGEIKSNGEIELNARVATCIPDGCGGGSGGGIIGECRRHN